MTTTLLVCVAASVAMIQMNLLLPMSGRAADSYVTNDLMRLPPGILTGVGFIGGGVMLRQEQHARLSIVLDSSGPGEVEIRRRLATARLSITGSRVLIDSAHGHREFKFDMRRVRLASDTETPNMVEELAPEAGVMKIECKRSA
jgi:uncharacterized membrane protein YhiD involved in acid resistance